MNLQEIRVDQATAWKQYRQYRDAKDDSDRELYASIRSAYYQLAKGHPIVNMEATIVGAGLTKEGLPKLALVRSDADVCILVNRRSFYGRKNGDGRWIHGNCKPDYTLPRDFVKAVGYRSYDAEAQVPFVPPAVKAKLRGGLHCYYTLFEAEWRKVPPRDPAILRHLGGPMYALLSVWDLTEVERLALSEYL